jgi:hypothetical protein
VPENNIEVKAVVVVGRLKPTLKVRKPGLPTLRGLLKIQWPLRE